MKRTMKKHVSLLLAVLMLLTSVGFNVIAAGEHTHIPDTDNAVVVNPTCTDKGYTEVFCLVPGCGESLYKTNYTEALKHTYSDCKYEETENGYYKYWECTRQYTVKGEVKSCDAKKYETEADGTTKTLYCKVSFVNNRVTASYDPEIKYTDVAATFKDEELYSCFVKRGEPVEYEGLIVPFREKTVEYGEYESLGWTTEDVEATAEENLTEAKCVDLATITATYEGRDIVLYPVFAGLNTRYTVIFYNYNNDKITNPQPVDHGTPAKYSDPTGKLYPTPTKDEDIVNYYEFSGWSANMAQTEGVSNDVIESTPIYGDAHFYPAFKPVAKRYTLEFYDETGENLLTYKNKDAVFENINIDTNFYTKGGAYEDIVDLTKTKREKASDKTYYYVWTGNWRVLRGDDTLGSIVNFNDFEVFADEIINEVDKDGNPVYIGDLPEGYTAKDQPNKEPKKIIRLVPVFERRLRVYSVDIEMQIPYGEDNDYYRGDAVVHVTANNNQLVASGKTDANGKFRCRLNYQVPFTVTVATADGKYLGNAIISDLIKPLNDTGDENIEAEINKCRVDMQLNPEYETHCSCIHHNALLQPIFVRILNILYTFFNVKYVCCYDMASTIGPLLDYVDDTGNII